MTEYWKSQARKYCEFCKCWFADNKVSISFHENGKKHKESVQKHISQLSKKSAKEFKQKEKIDDEMRKMEAAAMAAYLKDVQNNADLTSKTINDIIEKQGNSVDDITISSMANASTTPAWHEIKSEGGSSYFWNTKTNETTWDPPDNYLSIAQIEEKKLKEREQIEKKEKKLKKQKQKDFKQPKAKTKATTDKVKSSSSIASPFGPLEKPSKPYGTWTPVVHESIENIDLQLPKPSKELTPPPVMVEPEIIQFKEKRIESLGEADGPVEFKKRKFSNPKRNLRQKINDE